MMTPRATIFSSTVMLSALGTALLLALPACKSSTAPEPEPAKPATTSKDTAQKKQKNLAKDPKAEAERRKERAEAIRKARAKAAGSRKVHAKPVATVQPAAGDPLAGKFGMKEALDGLPGTGDGVVVELDTEAGKLTCELWPEKAPLTVANFIGLARGVRPWKKGGAWVKEPLYDGTVFHRVIKGFMIQGGDPAGNGSGGPGYSIPDEIWEDAHHDTRGQICMANRGPNTNGSQFFIMDGKASHLDGGYTIFGQCSPDSVIDTLSSTPVRGDRAVKPPKINKVTVRRK